MNAIIERARPKNVMASPYTLGHVAITGPKSDKRLARVAAERGGQALARRRGQLVSHEMRSGLGILNSAISGNSGQDAGPRQAWREGVFDGQEIRAAHPPQAHCGV